MKELTTYYTNKNIIFKEIQKVEPKELGSRKKIDIYFATSIDSEYYCIFKIDAKSRFLRKNADDLMVMADTLATYVEHSFKKKEVIINSPLCSKAKQYLKDNSWNVREDY